VFFNKTCNASHDRTFDKKRETMRLVVWFVVCLFASLILAVPEPIAEGDGSISAMQLIPTRMEVTSSSLLQEQLAEVCCCLAF
jgi:hypothetical protein